MNCYSSAEGDEVREITMREITSAVSARRGEWRSAP